MSQELNVVRIRMIKEPSWYSDGPLRNSQDVVDFIGQELATYDREVFCILNQNTDGSVINMNIVSMGSLNSSIVNMREVFKTSILSNAAGIIAIHNHPSGNVIPSMEDKMVTQKLREAGDLLDIKLFDHVITGRNGNYFSFADEGILNNDFRKEIRDRYRTYER